MVTFWVKYEEIHIYKHLCCQSERKLGSERTKLGSERKSLVLNTFIAEPKKHFLMLLLLENHNNCIDICHGWYVKEYNKN